MNEKTKDKKNIFDATPFLPRKVSLSRMQQAVQSCRGCDLYRHATQAVFGEGKKNISILMIGEQPGDKEDIAGRPFIGPAGTLLNQILHEVGLERKQVYITNAVKHFRFEVRGKRRLHKRPSSGQIKACRPWLEAEINCIKPKILVCLGASAAQAVLGKKIIISLIRGKIAGQQFGLPVFITAHPSSVLRVPDEASRKVALKSLVKDFKKLAAMQTFSFN